MSASRTSLCITATNCSSTCSLVPESSRDSQRSSSRKFKLVPLPCEDVTMNLCLLSVYVLSDTTEEATEQEFTLNTNLMYPFSLHNIPQSIQTIQPLGNQHEPNELQQKTCFPSTLLLGEDVTVVHPQQTLLRIVDARPCAQRTSLCPVVVRVEIGVFPSSLF